MAILFLLMAVVIIRGERSSNNQFTQALSVDSNQQLSESAVTPPATYLEVPALDDDIASAAHNEKPAEEYGLPPPGYYLPKPMIVKEAAVQPALYLTAEQSSQPPITPELSIQPVPLAIKAPVQHMLPLLPLPPMPMMGD